MQTVSGTLLSSVVTILAILFVFYTGLNVAQMRGKHKITAPAVTGNPEFERAYRVQVNTLEQFVMFLPLLWLATTYFMSAAWLPALLGLLWIVGRLVYMAGYMAAAEKRGTGFMITSLANAALLVLAVIGIAQAWMSSAAS